MKALRYWIAYWVLELQRRAHLVDAYLASHRGELVFAADCECRAMEIERRLVLLELNHGR